MTASTIQFITKTRLAELSRQRESLLSQYDAAEAAGRGHDLQCLAKMYDRLKSVRTTESPLHRDLPDLRALFHGVDAPQSLVDFWHEKLLTEIRRGRLRANIVYLFGAFLSEWDESDVQGTPRLNERRAEKTRILKEIVSPNSPPALDLMDSALGGFADHGDKVQAIIVQRLEKSLDLKLGGFDGLHWISANPHYSTDVRLEAKQFQENGALANQLSDAIRVANRDPRLWSWPEQGVCPRILWTRNRWRLYPTIPLVELLSVNHSAGFWSSAIDEGYTNSAIILSIRSRLQKLIDLNAPEVILSNERRMLAMQKDRASLDWYEPIDPWTNEPVLREDEGASVTGVVGMRATRQAELRDASNMGYGYGEGINPMVKLVHTEIELLRAAYPDTPLHVLKIDVRDYFASVPHETLLTMLRGLGMTDAGIDFTQRYLQVPFLTDADQVRAASRGVPMEMGYSHWLCEKLMRLLERFIHSQANVRIIRQLDDLCILGPSDIEVAAAYAAARSFLADVGLTLNDSKSGAVTISGSKHTDLPAGNPRWGVLELTDGGQWQVNKEAFQTYLNDSRKEVDARYAVLAKVLAYNDQLEHLVWGLGLVMDLGDHHRDSANKTLQSFENDFFGSGESIFTGLKSLIETRHRGNLREVPLAWMLWPITAGGIGLRSVTVLCGQYQMAFDVRSAAKKAVPKEASEDWQTKSNAWSEFYDDKNVTLEPANCDESRTMNALVEGFISRGKVISGGEQDGLSPYWRWTLSIFGPEILDKLGTFEFLLTDLVPLQLIHDKLISTDSPTADDV
ncbi:Reverse transcriptase (RNA-dependent DNA polymerase) [Rubripirellula tenax]|uniref:Reverse transcriptase (RNA-dependent DNA polymerase) n=1 Tax=Rubripirellula tenax TaxID=2528015 RepID=A0A5C6EIM7_9BACT|nr:reverse transcriptase domain-containing protein [Rubripirellula tenax]TWU48912.1 Reverse transcriptase (RNA-dependent DNA polymerase) [Rubripirellula tenax]